jgi:hypothetical protein
VARYAVGLQTVSKKDRKPPTIPGLQYPWRSFRSGGNSRVAKLDRKGMRGGHPKISLREATSCVTSSKWGRSADWKQKDRKAPIIPWLIVLLKAHFRSDADDLGSTMEPVTAIWVPVAKIEMTILEHS